MRAWAPLACPLALLACQGGPLLGCSGAVKSAPREPAPRTATASTAPSSSQGPRLFPPRRGPGVVEAGTTLDGSRRLLALGLRLIEHPDGSLEVSEDLLPAARSAKFLELPARLGGGFVFWITTSSATLLYRGASWTATLEPLAQLDFELERLLPGFDRLLLLPRRDADYRALDLETGQPAPPLGLPPAPAYGQAAFVDGWFGAVQVPLRGVLLSFDAGLSWHPLDLPATSVRPAGAALAITTPSAEYLLSARGELTHVADRDPAEVSAAAQAELARTLAGSPVAAERGREPLLQTAALSGFPDGHGGAFVASRGSLMRVRLDTGQVLERRERAFAESLECSGVRLGPKGVGFVCGAGQEQTRIYRVTEPLELELVLELPGARVVSESGNGALVIHGGCRERGSKLDHCVLSAQGEARELRAESERERLVALGDGRVAFITPPLGKSPGRLELRGGGPVKSAALEATRKEPRALTLFERGVWLDGMVESKPGVLQGWVVGASAFAGLELTLDGKVTLRRLQDNAPRALFAGRHALVLGENGLASETSDGGAEWQSLELPPELDVKAAASSGAKQGCSEIGCVFAGFTRIGYFAGRASRGIMSPQAPARVAFPGPGGSRWLLHCATTGEVSAPSLPARPPTPISGRRLRRPTASASDEVDYPALSPLLDRAPPALGENQQGVDAGTEPYGIQLRVYAYGPRGSDWTKSGALSIAFADRFSIQPGVQVTATARSPWPDAATAADALGAEPSTSAAGLSTALDPSGTAGALLLSSRGTMDLFLFEAGRVPVRIPNVGRLGMAGRFSGMVKTKLGTFLGSYDENSRLLRIYRVAGQDLEVALELQDIPPPRGANAEILRSAAGDALAIGVRGSSWFVHPIDLEAGLVDAPYQVTPAELSSMPAPCASDTEGFLMTSAPGPDPYIADLPAGMTARSFEARFRVSALGICIDALAAQGGREAGRESEHDRAGKPATSPRSPGRPSVPVILTERKPLGRRVGLRCTN